MCQSPFRYFFHILQALSDFCVVFKQLRGFLFLIECKPVFSAYIVDKTNPAAAGFVLRVYQA
jgi:hypothetical protein